MLIVKYHNVDAPAAEAADDAKALVVAADDDGSGRRRGASPASTFERDAALELSRAYDPPGRSVVLEPRRGSPAPPCADLPRERFHAVASSENRSRNRAYALKIRSSIR